MSRISQITEMYLEEISEHLKKGRAVVMVGAGFSKNAVKTVVTNKHFLNWNELGDIFYKKIYGKTPERGQECYLDAVKLASIVESIFGRPILDQLLLEHLPDEEYEPGELHKKLLSLNWADVFTTNYDTLLERTRKFVPNRKYHTVLCMEDLVYSSCPRIVKLHGSFPSYRPFVISQEDYRKYPKDCAVFVNTVQQALIENIFCLIGFSGDDPNFLSWIGWIRDNLGSGYYSKIYLITMDKERRVENILLSSRNIVVVNLFELLKEGETSYQAGFQHFFDELEKRQKDSEKRKWIENTRGISLRRLKNAKEDREQEKILKELYDFWEWCRQNYPGWIIAPYKERSFLKKSLDDAERYGVWDFLEKFQTIPTADKNFPSWESFIQLHDWIRQVCLLPLTERMKQIYEEILETDKDSTERETLRLSLLTHYRKTGENEKFHKQDEILYKTQTLTAEQEKQYQCERAMFFLHQYEYEALDKELTEWPLTVGNFGYELMHIGLMWEVEQYKQGLDLLVNMLDSIRSVGEREENLKVMSQEVYTLNLLTRAIPQVKFLSLNTNQVRLSQRNRDEILKADSCDPEKEIELFGALLTYPKAPDCDPEKEIELFRALLMCPKTPENEEELLHISIQFINFLERTGNFMVISSKLDYEKELKIAIEHIIKRNFYWGAFLSIRTLDDHFIRQMAEIGSLYIENGIVERITKQFCSIWSLHIFSVVAATRLKEQRSRYLIWGDYLPIVLGGLVHRCRTDTKMCLLDLAGEMAGMQDNFEELPFLVKNIFCSLNGIFIVEYVEKLLEFIIKIRTVERIGKFLLLDFCDFMLYDMRLVRNDLLDAICKRIDCMSEEDRKQSSVMCVKAILYHLGTLGKKQEEQFALDVKDSIQKIEFSLDYYSYVLDIIKEDNGLEEVIKKWLLEKLGRLLTCVNSDSGECMFQIQLFDKIKRLFRQYEFLWNVEDVETVLKQLNELVVKKNSIKKNQYYFLLGNYYLVLIEMLQETGWSLLNKAFEKNEEMWNKQKCLKFMKEGIERKDISEKEHQILDGIYGTDEEYFVIAVCMFLKYLREDVDTWKKYIVDVELALSLVVWEQGVLSPFCIEVFRILVRKREKLNSEMDVGILRKVLDKVYDLEVKSDFFLVQKIYGTRLAYGCLSFIQEEPKIKECVERWKNYVLKEGIYSLIAKQWGIC